MKMASARRRWGKVEKKNNNVSSVGRSGGLRPPFPWGKMVGRSGEGRFSPSFGDERIFLGYLYKIRFKDLTNIGFMMETYEYFVN
jgi:hypothetical protein